MEHQQRDKIAALLRESRIKRGYTQQELSEITGVSLRSVQRIENAEVLPRMHTWNVLSRHLEISPDLLNNERAEFKVSKHDTPSSASGDKILPIPFNHRQRIILTFGVFVLIVLLFQAFLAQSTRFPETDFELLLLLAAAVGCYTCILLFIWK